MAQHLYGLFYRQYQVLRPFTVDVSWPVRSKPPLSIDKKLHAIVTLQATLNSIPGRTVIIEVHPAPLPPANLCASVRGLVLSGSTVQKQGTPLQVVQIACSQLSRMRLHIWMLDNKLMPVRILHWFRFVLLPWHASSAAGRKVHSALLTPPFTNMAHDIKLQSIQCTKSPSRKHPGARTCIDKPIVTCQGNGQGLVLPI